ncbi:unnamed protein product [Rotaria sp. Silwood2]|nr:unnamed protein product [Rotaria sp. Silwood2]CAF3059517.1 unnamed protein product [Rotaria sp. Silwood2]CAF4024144.1 unnamed protein product [Rotaria sp. Silwood2]CAF4430691.1 unnamed protein product [Rotaria sp. Silwood2]
MNVWYSFGNIAGYGVDFNVNTAAGRLLTAGLYGIDDIKNGKILSDRIGVLVDTAVEEYYLKEISFGR